MSGKRFGETYDVRVLRTREEVESMRAAWEAMQSHPNADIDLLLAAIDTPALDIHPYVVMLFRRDQPQAMMVGRIQPVGLELRIGFKVLCKLTVRALTVLPGCFQGDLSSEVTEILITEVTSFAKRGKVDVVRVFDTPLESELFTLATRRPGRLSRDYAIVPGPHWKMSMPATGEGFFFRLGQKHRSRLRRAWRIVEQRNPGNAPYRVFHQPGHVDTFYTEAERILDKTYQRGIGLGFAAKEETCRKMAFWAEKGLWRGYILYVDGKPCAYLTGTLYGNVFYGDYTGHDPSYPEFNPGLGTILLAKTVEDLCNNAEVREIDLGFGDYFNKLGLGDHCQKEATVMIFAPTAFAVSLNLARSALFYFERCLKRVVDMLGVRHKVKRLWRRHLAGAAGPNASASDEDGGRTE